MKNPSRSHQDIIDEICEQLQPLKLADVDIANAVEARLKQAHSIYSRLRPVTNAKPINKAAKLFRAKFHKDKLAGLLQETLPEHFKELDQQLAGLEKITGPDVRFDTSIWVTVSIAKGLIKQYSHKAPTGTEGGPLRSIATLVHEYRTGEHGRDFKRACTAILKPRIPVKLSYPTARTNMSRTIFKSEMR
jgi:hypothetical protein